jgi:alpha-tubulin suppressor-like RCC1 family protein
LRGDGTVWCWGLNSHGQLGLGDQVNHPTPTQIVNLGGVRAIATGASHSCALRDDGTVWCWGENLVGQLGDGSTTAHSVPVQVAGLGAATSLAAGAEHTCAIGSDGAVRCWGDDEQGQLGDGHDGPGLRSTTPVPVQAPTGAVELTARGDHACARAGDGHVWCWGSNGSGELGDGHAGGDVHAAVPVAVADLPDATQVVAGGAHSCARRADGGVACWGNNGSGQLGVGYVSFEQPVWIPRAQPVPGLAQIARLAAGLAHTCAGDAAGAVTCWGANGRGQIGNGSFTMVPERGVPTPARVGGVASDALSAGATHSCAITDDGAAIQCWGGNRNGELGSGSESDDVPVPTRVALPCPQ